MHEIYALQQLELSDVFEYNSGFYMSTFSMYSFLSAVFQYLSIVSLNLDIHENI